MTEFELAELAYMQKSYAIELEMVTQGYVATLQTEATILLSFIFGYLMVAHFIGASLTKVQLNIINSLYLFTVLSDLAVYKGHYTSITYSVKRMTEVGRENIGDIAFVGTPAGLKVVVAAYSLMIIASLYFMWSVRDEKSDKDERESKAALIDIGLK